ncbi:MAG: hypothetical protein Q7U39_11995 [Nitrospira sp.]|nr:hypothetical protein [Nitrospira sp.]
MALRTLLPWRPLTLLLLCLFFCGGTVPGVSLAAESDELQIEVSKKGLGKEVVITQGAKEWFMMIEVTPENTVVVRQEKDHEKYLVDESETHDRPLVSAEVDAAIADYINSVKARAKKK